MSGYTDLRELGVVFRPPSRPLPPSQGVTSPFTASWTTTVELLAAELRHLDAERIVVEVHLEERHLRMDGMPRADARLLSDSVRLAFDSAYGPLMYETGRYAATRWRRNLEGWQVNLRAVALGLEALRKVDRYGITKRGEQYTGWKQLPQSTLPEDAIVTTEQAWAVLCDAAGLPRDTSALKDGISQDDVVRRAMKRSHPDVPGGSATTFRKVKRAAEVIGA